MRNCRGTSERQPHIKQDTKAPLARAQKITTRRTSALTRSDSVSAFERVLANDHFALHWDANGLRYGIGREISTWMNLGFHVVVNGSREHVQTTLEDFPDALIVCITAPVEIIRSRLSQRARESDSDIEKRIRRATSLALPTGQNVTTIVNDGALETAGQALTQALANLKTKGQA